MQKMFLHSFHNHHHRQRQSIINQKSCDSFSLLFAMPNLSPLRHQNNNNKNNNEFRHHRRPSTATSTSSSSNNHKNDIPIRPVFFPAAVKRAIQQPISKSIKSFSVITMNAIEIIISFIFNSLPYIIPTLRAYYHKRITSIKIPSTNSSLDIYSTGPDSHTLPALLSCSKPPTKTLINRLQNPVLLYVHGGAWGLSDAWIYATLANSIVNKTNCSVIVLNYDAYPDSGVQGQIDDLTGVFKFVKLRLGGTPFVCMAHSSGAHVSVMSLLMNRIQNARWKFSYDEQTAMQSKFADQDFRQFHQERYNSSSTDTSSSDGGEGKIAVNDDDDDDDSDDNDGLPDVMILTAGVYHLGHHFLYEARRGVNSVSPMQPASNADGIQNIKNFLNLSPTLISETMQPSPFTSKSKSKSKSKIYKLHKCLPPFLEGDIGASNLTLPPCTNDMNLPIPYTFILASSADTTVPMYSSVRFAASLKRAGCSPSPRLLVYDGVGHQEFVTQWFNAESDAFEQTGVLDVDINDEKERLECLGLMHGRRAAEYLSSRVERNRAGSAYLRDVLRILEAVSLTMNHD